MPSMESADLKRMILAIEHECDVEIKRIMQETRDEYNRVRNEVVAELTKALSKKYDQKVKQAEKTRQIQESRLRNESNKKYAIAKYTKVDLFIERIRHELRNESLSKRIYKKTLKKMEISETSKEHILFCNKKDSSNVRLFFNGEIREMPKSGLGGVVICSRNGSILCDNSFSTRLETFLQTYMSTIRNHIV
ncbi:hypothetical protein ECANGB1_1088 [Enterospora canceri]|uniref:V-type proton ATPase subunit E n=1 Tax=Enterospora canceri TaxID=1081671 RepID=A0A1Y1S6T3_9MICR|nr:hypothetical protein ECANGB1_1088 [Enterospora canceri]